MLPRSILHKISRTSDRVTRSRQFTVQAEAAPSNEAEMVKKKKKTNKTAEGGADKDIRPFNKQLRDLIADTKYQEAKELFAKMKSSGPRPNLPTFNIMTNLFKAENDFAALQNLQEEMTSAFKKTKKSLTKPSILDGEETPESSRPRPVRVYRPAYRTGPHALLRALHIAPNAKEGVSKDDLIAIAQPLCDVSFSVPSDYNGFYTAWNSMASLIQKGLVQKIGGIRSSESEMGITYQLTEAGETLARELTSEALDIEQGKSKVPPQPKRSASAISVGAGSDSGSSASPKPGAEADS